MVEIGSPRSSSSSKFRECDCSLKFLLDKNLSEYLSLGLKAFGENVIHLTEVLPGEHKLDYWCIVPGQVGPERFAPIRVKAGFLAYPPRAHAPRPL